MFSTSEVILRRAILSLYHRYFGIEPNLDHNQCDVKAAIADEAGSHYMIHSSKGKFRQMIIIEDTTFSPALNCVIFCYISLSLSGS